ncbi:MAG: hypothetical protein K5840_05660 [Eubacterium sp.]|nr:hypothetical protein [Eubacterium sp.]
MLKKITENLGLKILAILFAVVLWLVVVNVEDPEITKTYTVEVTQENTDVVEDAGMVYEVLDSSDTINVTVTAKRSIIENLSASDFNAVADFSDIKEELTEGEHSLLIYVSMNRYSSQVTVDSGVQYLSVSLEEEMTQTFEVSASFTGTVADGYIVSGVTCDPATVKVSGPSSVVSQIATAKAVIDVSDFTSDVTQKVEVTFYNESNEAIDSDRLIVKKAKVAVTADISMEKTVTLDFSYSGEPADGYEVAGISSDVNEVTILGDTEALAEISSISIPASVIDISGRSSDYTVEVNLEKYLPDGVTLSSSSSTATVTVTISPYGNTVVKYSTSDIVTSGIADGMQVAFSAGKVTIEVSCDTDTSDSLSASDFTVSADFTDITEAGTYTITLDVEAPDGVTVSGDVTAEVVVTSTDTTEDDSTTDTTDSEADSAEDTTQE